MPFALVLTALVAGAGPLSSQADRPYVLKVCIRFSADPVFTPVFMTSVPREARDQLRNFFGALAEVEMVEHHPWLEKHVGEHVDAWQAAKGPAAEFQAGGAEGKLFVFDIDYDEGAYRIAWRQLDGDVQQVGPLRTRTTFDRPWLAKELCLAVKDDFAPVAVVTPGVAVPGTGAVKVMVEFRGFTRRKELLAEWLGDDCVLQPFSVERKGNVLAHKPIADTVLRMSRKDGLTMARVESNRSQPWRQRASVVGFQAIRLRTLAAGRIRVKLIDAETGAPLKTGCQVKLGDEGFAALADAKLLLDPDLLGFVVSPPLKHVAYVRVMQGGAKIEFPVPLIDDWNERPCKVVVDKLAREKSDLARQKDYLMQDIRALKASLGDYGHRINDLNGQKRYEDALREDETALEFADRSHRQIKDDIATAEKMAAEALLTAADARLGPIVEGEKEIADLHQGLRELAENLRKTIATNNARNRANVQKDLGKQKLLEGDAEAAIANYEQALEEFPDQPALKKELGRIKEAWRIKSPKHQTARDFVFKKWAECELPDLDGLLPEAERAMVTLRDSGDYPSLKRLGIATGDHAEEVADLLEDLADRTDEADQEERKEYEAVLDRITQFRERVTEAEQQAITAGTGPASAGADGGDAEEPAKKPKSPPQEDEEN